jgi:hypothetical protein
LFPPERESSAIFDHYPLQRNRTILLFSLDVRHFSDRFHARNDPSKNCVLPVQVRCRFERHEELRSVRVGFARIRHAHDPFSIVFVVFVGGLVFVVVAAAGCSFFVFPVATVQRTEASCAIEPFPIACLDTKPGHNTVELTPAVRRLGGSSVRSNRRIRIGTDIVIVIGIGVSGVVFDITSNATTVGTQRQKRLTRFWTVLNV